MNLQRRIFKIEIESALPGCRLGAPPCGGALSDRAARSQAGLTGRGLGSPKAKCVWISKRYASKARHRLEKIIWCDNKAGTDVSV